MADTLQAIVTRRAELVSERNAAEETHKATMSRTAAELAALAKTEACIVDGLDAAKIARGRAVVYVHGLLTNVADGLFKARSVERARAMEAAKRDIASGGGLLVSEYRGVKNYDRFGDQTSGHPYGMGPRHGHIVFEIGLTRDIRDRVRTGGEMTADEIDAALYLLTVLPKIEAAEAKAAA